MHQVNLPVIVNAFITQRQQYDLEHVVNWEEKLSRQNAGKNPAFDPNELVRVKGFIEYDENGLRLHVDMDGRIADNFYLKNPIDPETAKKYNGFPLESIVRILQYRDEKVQISNIQNYDVTLVDISKLPLINPDSTQTFSETTQAIIYGKFIGYAESGQDRFLKSLGFPEGTKISGESGSFSNGHSHVKLILLKPNGERECVEVDDVPNDYNKVRTYGIIMTEDGRKINVEMPTGKLVFSDGNLENIEYKVLQEGDTVRISAKIINGEIFAHWCDPCILVGPSSERLRAYEDLRMSIAHNIQRTNQFIDEGNYSDARLLLAEIRAREITSEELSQTYELAASIPKTHRPMLVDPKNYYETKSRNYFVASLDRAYGIRLESLTETEFIKTAEEILSGNLKECDESTDATYLFYIAEQFGFDNSIIEKLALSAINSRTQRMIAEEDPKFDDKYVLAQTIRIIEHNKTPNHQRIITETVQKLQDAKKELPYQVESCYKKLMLQNCE
ncbi:MAG: hypothetical protein ACMXYG_07530 [Candidatus Woesearchaeota archaeon]